MDKRIKRRYPHCDEIRIRKSNIFLLLQYVLVYSIYGPNISSSFPLLLDRNNFSLFYLGVLGITKVKARKRSNQDISMWFIVSLYISCWHSACTVKWAQQLDGAIWQRLPYDIGFASSIQKAHFKLIGITFQKPSKMRGQLGFLFSALVLWINWLALRLVLPFKIFRHEKRTYIANYSVPFVWHRSENRGMTILRKSIPFSAAVCFII